MWGVIPLRNQLGFQSFNRRWAFGSHDICFTNRYPLLFFISLVLPRGAYRLPTVVVSRFQSAFFTAGQVLPTHRSLHSPYGGLFQPTVTQAIRLLSHSPESPVPHTAPAERQRWGVDNTCVDPFSEVATAYTTTGDDGYLAPSAYSCNSHSWIHIFPEGKVHQASDKTMRYFKWGVSRLILEATECPDIVPMWIEGTSEVMSENRAFPRFIPRINKRISVTFGDKTDSEAVFGDLRSRWRKIKEEAERASDEPSPLGVLSEELMYGEEAVELRKECTMRVRDLVLQVRRSRGHSDEDPKASLGQTWLQEGSRREGKMKDGSWVRDV